MNEKQFDSNLRAAFIAPEMPMHMDHKIDAAIAKSSAKQTHVRRLVVSLGATTAVMGGIFVFPSVKAQASLGGILNAIDKETSAIAKTYTVGENGERWLSATTIVANGDTSTISEQAERKIFDVGIDRFVWNPTTKKYVKAPRRGRVNVKLSDLLGPASSFSFNKRVTLDQVEEGGKPVTRATVLNGDLPERYVIFADSKTNLPTHIQVESLEANGWRLRQDTVFEYQKGLRVSLPDFKKSPPITEQENVLQYQKAMTSSVVATLKAKDHTLLVRKVDVADDGTVFICYQKGSESNHSWSGYSFMVKDNLGTKYFHAGDIHSDPSSVSMTPKDGALELEILIPEKPIDPAARRELEVMAFQTKAGNLDKFFDFESEMVGKSKVNVKYPDGHLEEKEFDRAAGLPTPVRIAQLTFEKSTCLIRPEWAENYLGNDIFARIELAGYRASHFIKTENWKQAERELVDQLVWMRESERQGLSPWATGGVKDQLKMVRQKLGQP